jgi:3D (Asp-Asp-Asp) domain-containing protein
VQVAGLVLLAGLVAMSAVVVKHARTRSELPALAEVEPLMGSPEVALGTPGLRLEPLLAPASDPIADGAESSASAAPAAPAYPVDTRWFNGRPVRPARTLWMTVTGYSPDERSCGDSADGITSSLHSVWTNGMKLVAADTSVLPLGSMVSLEGYDDGQVVPVLDRGGAIKGYRLDLLFPTHEQAREWGVKKMKVTVWEYADGRPAGNWREIRDSK